MKKFIYAVLLICGTALVSFAVVLPIVPGTRVGQGFNVHYEGNVLVYEGKIDGDWDKDITLLKQSPDIAAGYEMQNTSKYEEHGNIVGKFQSLKGGHAFVRFEWLDNGRTSEYRTYYWDIPFLYTDPDTGNVSSATQTIRIDQDKNFGGGCSAGFFAPFALLLATPLILRRFLKK